MKQLLVLLVLFVHLFNVSAQQTMNLRDAIIGYSTYLKPTMPVQLQWKDARHYVMVKDNQLWQYNIQNGDSTALISLAGLNSLLKEKEIPEAVKFPTFTFINESVSWFQTKQHLITLNLKDKSITQSIEYPAEALNLDFNSTNFTLAYTIGNNLFITDAKGKQQITKDQNPNIVNGASVHRNEFGIQKGTFWSPKGNLLAFYRMDETMVGDYPLVDYMAREAKLVNIKYPMAGMTSHEVKLGIYNLATGQTTYMKTGLPADHYLTNISWSPDGKNLFIAELNREQNHMKLNQYNASTGEFAKTILEEKNSKYVEPQHPIIFSTTNTQQFYYQSLMDGWNHVYLYDLNGKKLAQLTKGKWEVTELLGFDEKEKHLFVQSTRENSLERHLYRVHTGSGKIERLTQQAGTHSGLLSPDTKYLIDRWSSTEVPGQVDLIASNGTVLKTISKATNTLNGYELGENTVFTIKAADGTTDLNCRMIKPNDFDPSKKYPVIVYVYGGPHAQLVSNTWHNDARWWQYYMASKGYIAFTVDNRGTENRGSEFEQVTHRQLGVIESADQMKGIDYLKSLSYVDSQRIGVHGWSYGGFMTINLMLHQPETFKVGVAGGPVIDWSLYEVMYGERYMDTPEENAAGYEQANLLNHAEKLQGKLMLIHGVQDQTVVMQHSIQFLKKSIDLGKQVDFFVYPTHEHNVRGTDRLHLMEKVSNYFLDHL